MTVSAKKSTQNRNLRPRWPLDEGEALSYIQPHLALDISKKPPAEVLQAVDKDLIEVIREHTKAMVGARQKSGKDFSTVVKELSPTLLPSIILGLWYNGSCEQKTFFIKPEKPADPVEAGKDSLAKVLEAEGGHVGASEVSLLLGITRQAVLKRYKASRLLLGWRGVRQAEVRFPVWQFDSNSPDRLLFGLQAVLKVFNEFDYQDDLARLHFFLKPRGSLDGNSPLDLLRKGDLKPVVQAAYHDAGP